MAAITKGILLLAALMLAAPALTNAQANKSIYGMLQSSPEKFSMLVNAIQAAGLVDTLSTGKKQSFINFIRCLIMSIQQVDLTLYSPQRIRHLLQFVMP